MNLAAGTRIGSFEIVEPIGAGGMGEVYRARDMKLGRDVALKILPPAFASDRERLARFEREARMLATLNHPHIAQIHGLEHGALVMELVDGEDLADRIRSGPIPVSEAIAIAEQIADALSAAHDVGVIHRDLKPGNIRVRGDGTIKLLDFGLAKANDTDPTASSSVIDNSPTITSPAITSHGVILGTAAYMAPEQAKGHFVDRRADVWAFGIVLYEMLSGRRPFDGASSTEVIAQILEREPDWRLLPGGVPVAVMRVLRRCLQKDPRRRMRDAGDIRIELGERALEPPQVAGQQRVLKLMLVGAIGVAIGAAAVLLWSVPSAAPSISAKTSHFVLLQGVERIDTAGRLSIALSPDGRRVVFPANRRLNLRTLDELTSRPIAGTEEVATPTAVRGNAGFAIQPIFSPDGESIAYVHGNQLRRVATVGGQPSVICECADASSATWTSDNTILFGVRNDASGNGIWRVAATGGTPERVIDMPVEQIALSPQLMPDRAHVLFTVTHGAHWNESDVVIQSIGKDDRQVIVKGGIDGRYTKSGHLVYAKDGVIYALKFDPATLQVSGNPAPVLTGVTQQTSAGAWGGFAYAMSDDGSVIYQPAAGTAIRRALIWVDRQGNEEVLPAEPRAYQYPRLSRDGQRVALDLRDQENDVWSWDLARSTLTRLTQHRWAGGPAIWNGDGNAVIFGPDVGGFINLHLQPLAGGPPQRLAQTTNTQYIDDLTPDGKWLVIAERAPATGFNLRRMRIDGTGQAQDVLVTQFNEMNSDVSPDGRWIAYQSDESGRTEVYVRPFPAVNEARWQVSANGGSRPLWSRDGRELFFFDQSRRMTVVPVTGAERLAFGAPQTMFDAAPLGLEGQQRNFDLSMDGKRFLMVRNLPPPENVPTLVMIQNWFSTFPR